MSLLTKLERKIGWMGIDHLPLYIVTAQAILYVWGLLNPGQASLLVLDPYAISESHEYWRFLTFLFVTPIQNPLFAFFFLYLLFVYGGALESAWGSFHFTLFYLIGVLGTLISAFYFGGLGGAFYLNTSIFLAFAAVHPDVQLLLLFIIPVKVKWLAWFTWAGLAYSFFISPVQIRMAILISLANYFLFFGKAHWDFVWERIRAYQHKKKFKDKQWNP